MGIGRLPDMGEQSRDVLAANLVRLMADAGETIAQLHERCPTVSTGTIDRIRRAAVSAGVDNVAALAAAYSLEPWQMLMPGIKAGALPAPDTHAVEVARGLLEYAATLERLPPGVTRLPPKPGPAGKEVTGYTKAERRRSKGDRRKDTDEGTA